MKITADTIRTHALPESGQTLIWDTLVPGFGVRLSAGGSRSYIVQYRDPRTRKTVRKTLGRVDALTLTDARKLAREQLLNVEPVEAERIGENWTLADAWSWYEQTHIARQSSSYQRMVRTMRKKHLPEAILKMPLVQIRRSDLIAIIDTLLRAGKAGTAKFMQAQLKALFGRLMEAGIVESNPLAGTRSRVKLVPRDRVLSDGEISAVWNAAHSLEPSACLAVHLLMITACRRAEILELRQSEYDRGEIAIGRDRVKNRSEHRLTLPRRMAARMSQHEPTGATYMFVSAPNQTTLNGTLIVKQLRKVTGIHDFTLHDLRRTAATNMARIGVPPYIVEAVLNHRVSGVSSVAGVYNRYSYAAEKADALQRLEDAYRQIVKPVHRLAAE